MLIAFNRVIKCFFELYAQLFFCKPGSVDSLQVVDFHIAPDILYTDRHTQERNWNSLFKEFSHMPSYCESSSAHELRSFVASTVDIPPT